MNTVHLPMVNENRNYEIRLESIGGLGANLCGKMLGELGIRYLNLNSASFSSYGSEKTGTPVKAFIRYSAPEEEIRVHSPVKHPHMLAIFHEALMNDSSVFEGCTHNTVTVINTVSISEETIKKIVEEKVIKNPRNIYYIPAQKIAMETHSRINVVMLGAVAKVMGFVPLEALNNICKDNLGRKYPESLPSNLEGIRRGYEEVQKINIVGYPENMELGKETGKEKNKKSKVWGYQTAPIGGINTQYGNSVISDLSPSRQGYIPIFVKERCINCGLCDSACPDMVFQFEEGEYKGREMMINKGLDYYHCKGCLRCVSVCPSNALVRGLEAEYPEKQYFMPNKELLRNPDYYEKTGSDGYITSESYLTEKRMDGGEV